VCAYLTIFWKLSSFEFQIFQQKAPIRRSHLALSTGKCCRVHRTKQTNSCSHLPTGRPKCSELESQRNMRGHNSQQFLLSFVHPRAETSTIFLPNMNLPYIITSATGEIHIIPIFSDDFCR